MNGWVKLRRGLLDHLPEMKPSDAKLYLGLLLLAKATGADKGVVSFTLDTLVEALGMSRSAVKRSLQALEPRYIRTVAKGRNQWAETAVRVVKFEAEEGPTSGQSNPEGNPDEGQIGGFKKNPAMNPARQIGGFKKNPAMNPATEFTPYIENSSLRSELEKDKEARAGARELAIVHRSETAVADGRSAAFDLWYRAYPRKGAPDEARQAFVQSIRTDDDWRRLLANTKAWMEHEFAYRDSDKIPFAKNFLGRGDWRDAPEPVRPAAQRTVSAMAGMEGL